MGSNTAEAPPASDAAKEAAELLKYGTFWPQRIHDSPSCVGVEFYPAISHTNPFGFDARPKILSVGIRVLLIMLAREGGQTLQP